MGSVLSLIGAFVATSMALGLLFAGLLIPATGLAGAQHGLAQARLRLVAAGDALHAIALRLQIVPEEEGQRLFIFHDQNTRRVFING